MDLLFDGDIIVRKCAYVAEGKSQKEALQIVDDYMTSKIDYFMTFLSRAKYLNTRVFVKGDTSFRKELCPEYHSNRKEKKDPEHMQAIREHLINSMWKATSAKNGYEVDDVLGFLQTKAPEQSTVIATIDKDLDMIPGYKYDLDKQALTYILPYDAIRCFFKQLLIGDPVDNVKGVDGIGVVGANKLLKGLLTEEQMFQIVQEQYQDDERMLKNSKLLWIMRADKQNPVMERLETK
jgi:DNA polymerase I